MSKAEPARRLSAHGPQVDRLPDMRHKSRTDAVENALHHLGVHLAPHTVAARM